MVIVTMQAATYDGDVDTMGIWGPFPDEDAARAWAEAAFADDRREWTTQDVWAPFAVTA
jgi:hypothetical protein